MPASLNGWQGLHRLHQHDQGQVYAAFGSIWMSAGLRWSGCEGALVADGQDPNTLLEGSIESLVPLWRWILWHLTPGNDAGGTAPGPVPRDVWPSWAGHTLGIA